MKQHHFIWITKPFFISLALMLAALPAAAQSWVKKASKSVFTVKTFSTDGTLLGSANGFYIGEQGEAVSNYSLFKGAERAVIIDASGHEFPVKHMLGADETYDIAKFRVDSKKTVPLALNPTAASIGTNVYVLPYREAKTCPAGVVRKAETFRDDYDYLTLALPAQENAGGSPLLDEAGLVVGIMQQPWQTADSLSYAVGIRYADSLHISGLSINDPALRAIGIKKDLPDELSQAVLTLYMAGASQDSATYASLVEDFISKYPNAPDGYQYRAQQATDAHDFASAQRDMEQAIKVAEKKDEAHFNYARLIYQKEVYMSQYPYDGWSLDKALSEIKEAEQLNPNATYRHQEAAILYAQKKYEEAYQVYTTLFNSELRSADMFFEASRCKEMANDTTMQMALLDSCIATFSRPYLKEAAPYILVRAQALLNAGKYRNAVNDLNDYQALMPTNLNANFYYIRHQAEVGGRLFQQALNDINQAIQMEPENALYLAELASLQVRLGLYDEAVQTAKEHIRIAPEGSDGYLFLGLAQCLKGQKQEGVANLQKAKELGDSQVDALIEKYAK